TVLAQLAPAQAIVLKLLYIEDFELDAEDLRQLTQRSGRGVPEVIAAVERLRATIRLRQVGRTRVTEQLETVHAWIAVHARRLQRVAHDRDRLPPNSEAATRVRVTQERVTAQLRRHQRQRDALRAAQSRRKVTARYKDIAALLNTSVGNVASQIARVRQDVLR